MNQLRFLGISLGIAVVVSLTILNNLLSADSVESHLASQWVSPGPDGTLVCKTAPADDRIMDRTQMGYMGGGMVLPNGPVKRSVRPSGAGHRTAAMTILPETLQMSDVVISPAGRPMF